MKKIIFLLLVVFSTTLFAQDLPSNPEPGKCYVRCSLPDVYVNETIQVLVKPAYNRLRIVPVEYKTVTERILVKAAGKKLIVIPEKWGTETISYEKEEQATRLNIVPASFSTGSENVEIKPAYAQWELGASAPDCDSSNPNDCRYWCYKGYPATYKLVEVSNLVNDVSVTKSTIEGKFVSYTTKVIIEPARVVEEEIPAQYKTIEKRVVVKDAYTIEEKVDAVYKTMTKEVLKTKGELTTWKEVECSLVEYQALPINWNLNSATLTLEAKRLIDTRLMPVLKQNPGVKLEIASHTDSRGTFESNQDLSERRAQAVVKYLETKGINNSLLVANGYGEKKLKNRCSDGVSCTERDHAVNRRTEFRLINQ